MAKEFVGLKLGASRINAARVSVNGSAEVVQLASSPLPQGLIAGGEVRQVEPLGEALKDFFKRHKLPKRNVRIGLANNRIGVRTIEISGIEDPKQLANAVRFRAQEALPIPIDEAVLDFQVLSETPAADGVPPSARVLLVVAYRDLIGAYVEATKLAGIRLAGVDLEAFALLRALTTQFETQPGGGPERSALVAVSIGSERSVLAVSDGFSCEYTRVLEWGGNALTDHVARALECEPEEAERIKIGLGLQGDEVPEGVSPERAVQAREALRVGLQGFGRELVSSLQFYQGQPDSLGIRELVLAGGTAQLAGLATGLQQLVGVPVRVGDPMAGVSVGRKLKGESPNPSYAVPIGLGMAV
jgi:type IV pilus assembly protein PilM